MKVYDEKTPLQSKKFLAYMCSNLFFKFYMFYATMRSEGDLVVMTAIISSTFLDIGYILGQASLDKYIKMIETTAEKKSLT